MSKKFTLLGSLFVMALLIFVVIWQVFFTKKINYYLVSIIIIVSSMLFSFRKFEKNSNSSIEISFTAVVVALAVASRAVFYLVPQVKPIAAVVIAFAVCSNAQKGFFVGAMSAFISNFIFGQGIWTPFQMMALGTVGFVAGLIFKFIKPTKTNLAIVGFVSVFVFYGVIVDLSSVFMMLDKITIGGVISIYSGGILFNLAFAISTALFLLLFGEQFVKKINRIKKKYGLFDYTLER